MSVRTDCALRHGFKERALRARRGTIDFIGQHHVCKDGALLELKGLALAVINTDAGDVGRQEIRGALDTAEGTVKAAGERIGQNGLADARNILNQYMATRKQTDHQAVNRLQIAHVDAGDIVTKAMEGGYILHLFPPQSEGEVYRSPTSCRRRTHPTTARFLMCMFHAHAASTTSSVRMSTESAPSVGLR